LDYKEGHEEGKEEVRPDDAAVRQPTWKEPIGASNIVDGIPGIPLFE